MSTSPTTTREWRCRSCSALLGVARGGELGFRASITAMCINQDVMTTAYEIETRTCPNMRKCTECENLGKTFFECLEAVKADDPESCYRCWGGAPWNEFKLCLENQCGWI